MNKFFEKTSMTYETRLLFMLYVCELWFHYAHILHKASIYAKIHPHKSILNNIIIYTSDWSLFLK